MNYETALKLKTAGFPQLGDGFMIILNDPALVESDLSEQTVTRLARAIYVTLKLPYGKDRFGEDVYEPSLEELISECGEDFQMVQNSFPLTDTPWTAESYRIDPDTDMGYQTFGKTASEAVANLYLSLEGGRTDGIV